MASHRLSLNSLPEDLLAHVLRFASGAQRRDNRPTPAVSVHNWSLAAVSRAFRRAYLSNLTSLSLNNPSAKRLALLGWAPLRPCTSLRHVTITPDSKLSDADVVSLFHFLNDIGAQLKKVQISLSRRLTHRALLALTDCFSRSIVDLELHVPWERRVRRRTTPAVQHHFLMPPPHAHLPDDDDATPDSTPHNSPPPSPPHNPIPIPVPDSPLPAPALDAELMLPHLEPGQYMFAEPEQPAEPPLPDLALPPHLFNAAAFPNAHPHNPPPPPAPPQQQHPFDYPVLDSHQPAAAEPQQVESDNFPVDNLLLPMWDGAELPIDPFEQQPQLAPNPPPPELHAPPEAPLDHQPPLQAIEQLAQLAVPDMHDAADNAEQPRNAQQPMSPQNNAAPPEEVHEQPAAQPAAQEEAHDGSADAQSASEPPTPIEQAIQDLSAFLHSQNGLLNGHGPFVPPVDNPHDMMLQLIQNFNQMQDGGAWNGDDGDVQHAEHAGEGDADDGNEDDNGLGNNGDGEHGEEQPEDNNALPQPNYHPALLQNHFSHRSNLTDEILVTTITRMPNLQSLNLDRARYITDVSAFALRNLTMLQSLRICNNHYVTDLPLKHVLANLPNLRELRLQDMLFIGNGSIEALCSFKKRSKLRVLQLSQIGRVTDEAVKKLVNSCQNLESIHIADCPRISCEAASHLSCSQTLEEIYFKPVARYSITNRTTVHLSCASSRLRSLKLVGCRSITLDGIVALGNLPGLRQLHLIGLGPVSQDVMRALGTFPKLDDILLQGDMHLTDLGVKVLCGRRGHRFLHLALRDNTENLTYDGLDSIVTWCTSLRSLEVHGMFKSDAIDRVRDCIPYANITVGYNGGTKSFVEGRGGVWDPADQMDED
eukprot:TRINITY_DN40112_c0_g1_i1.p1 TRINITY_DN40112_c0_g1~~TRINITY_DN40112_c0_g1_i1.p1  ORF type:complete len:1013 (-),score=179.63 TRINITY_DN40112_c0_g1_i1:390-3014(-)